MFRADAFYRPPDEEMRVIGSVQTLAKWRCDGEGPRYVKFGARVLYRGSDILDWIDRQTVGTADHPVAA